MRTTVRSVPAPAVASVALAAVLASSPSPLPAQHDLLGVTFDGRSVAFSSRSGDAVVLTTNTAVGQNALARVGNVLFTTEREPAGGPQTTRARVSWLYGQWLKEQAQRYGIPALPARPWDSVFERVIAAAS